VDGLLVCVAHSDENTAEAAITPIPPNTTQRLCSSRQMSP
jgi:hypothetical protein